MSGQELIEWLVRECNFRKLPPSDSALILVLRELPDIDTWVKTLRHNPGRDALQKETKG